MKRWLIAVLAVLGCCAAAQGVVFMNEVFINPTDSYDDTREYVELLGTPGKKLDGYAIAFVSGGLTKYYPLNSITAGTLPEFPEVDEFFSLDGLSLGPNGLLVIGIGTPTRYPTLLADTRYQRWNTIWNGGLDTPGKLQNDGSNTIFLIRNRPGSTQANPSVDLRWGKDINPDAEVIRPVSLCVGGTRDGKDCGVPADCPGGTCSATADQYGDGNLDKGLPNGLGGNTLDLKGSFTLLDESDDLEIVDEVSYESDQGWEHDQDDRNVDEGSSVAGLRPRNVHALGDPQGFNPDALTRLDYRTQGPGWPPAAGATGELPGGNNWQDTATEQWIRGDSVLGTYGQGTAAPYFFFSAVPNSNLDAIQPYQVQVPLWLADGSGAEFDFTLIEGDPNPPPPAEPDARTSFQVMAGRLNPLAIPFIPGDADRDGDCDADDIAKIAAVFGDPAWIFSNSFEDAAQSDDGDPAQQTRPWDVDATGEHGIEPSDLQWTLNFQGDTTGRVVGRLYAGSLNGQNQDVVTRTPLGAGVVLNPTATDGQPNPGPNTVTCSVTTLWQPQGPRPMSALKIGDQVVLTVRGTVSGGAILTAGQQNGIMQFVHDLTLATGGVLRVEAVEPVAPFATTRAALQSPQGSNGDLGIHSINGYTTSFLEGLSGADDLYRVHLRAVGAGSTTAHLAPAGATRLAASTPTGLKIGHSNNLGNPASVGYPTAESLTVLNFLAMDFDEDNDVDGADWDVLTDCFTGPALPYLPAMPACGEADLDADGDVDLDDAGLLQRCYTGAGVPSDPACAAGY